MSDNVPYTADPTQIWGADDIGGVKHQRVKLSLGPDGSATDALPNTEGTLLASALRTTTTQSPDQTNTNARGVQVTLNVTVGVTLSLTLTIQAKDPVSGTYYDLNAAPTAVTGTGLTVYSLYPGVGAASGGVTQRTSAAVPKTWRVNVTHGNANNATYSVGYALIV
jgi:hypothetical protein